MVSLGPSLLLFAAAAALGLLGLWARKQIVFGIGKPVATVFLFAVLGGLPAGQRGILLLAGILLSLAADIALLADGYLALKSGLLFFLMAHLCYALGFWQARPELWLLAPALVVFGAASLWLVRYQGRRWGSDLRVPIVAHVLTLTLMVTTIFSTLAGPAALQPALVAAAGAVMFYISQALLPWVRLRRVSRWAQTVTLVTYWAGQLCLVLAARWGLGEKLVR